MHKFQQPIPFLQVKFSVLAKGFVALRVELVVKHGLVSPLFNEKLFVSEGRARTHQGMKQGQQQLQCKVLRPLSKCVLCGDRQGPWALNNGVLYCSVCCIVPCAGVVLTAVSTW